MADLSVRQDPDILQQEAETILRFARDEDVLHVFSAEAGIMNRLLHHPEFSCTLADVKEVEGEAAVVGVVGTMPLGTLSIKFAPRSTTQHSLVVSGKALREGEFDVPDDAIQIRGDVDVV